MSIKEFLKQFNDIILYKFQLKIGGARSNMIISDEGHKSYSNFKGKMYPFYKRELFESTTEYIPLEEMDVHLDLTIECSYPHKLNWERRPKSTKKEMQSFDVRILTEDASRQLGFLSLNLNQAGDIYHKFCAFYSEDGTHEITQSVNYRYDDKTKKVKSREELDFISTNLETGLVETVTFHKDDGVLKCVTISKQPVQKSAYVGLIWSEGEISEKKVFFSRYCNNESIKAGTYHVCDFANYVISSDYINRLERIEELKGKLRYENDPRPCMVDCDYTKIREDIKRLEDPKSDIFGDFYGEYIGNTIIMDDSKSILVIETLKDGYHYFTSVDISDTDAFNYDMIGEYHDSPLYFQRLKESEKTPMFRTKISDGEEEIIPLGDHITDEELRNYELFKSYCTESFGTIEKEKLSSLTLDKYSNSGNKHKLINKRNPKN